MSDILQDKSVLMWYFSENIKYIRSYAMLAMEIA